MTRLHRTTNGVYQATNNGQSTLVRQLPNGRWRTGDGVEARLLRDIKEAWPTGPLAPPTGPGPGLETWVDNFDRFAFQRFLRTYTAEFLERETRKFKEQDN